MSILQGRFEALHQGAAQVEPHHLVLGLVKTMDPALLTRLGLDPSACTALIAQLGSTPDPAPLSPADIEYAQACYDRIALAITRADASMVDQEHLVDVLRDPSWP